MKKILILTIVLNSLLFAANDSDKKIRAEKQLQLQMEKEKKYSKEQTFYKGKEFDLKAYEVNPDSVSSMPDVEIHDDSFDMDDVY